MTKTKLNRGDVVEIHKDNLDRDIVWNQHAKYMKGKEGVVVADTLDGTAFLIVEDFPVVLPTRYLVPTGKTAEIDKEIELLHLKKPRLSWNEAQIYSDRIEYLMEEEGMSEEEAREDVHNDYDYSSWEFECMESDLSSLIQELNPWDRPWRAEVSNFGWQNLDGHKEFDHTDSGQEFLRNILPDTDCTFFIYVDYANREIRIQNYHHDSPVGNEWYYIRPAIEECEWCHGGIYDPDDIVVEEDDNGEYTCCVECRDDRIAEEKWRFGKDGE